MRKLLVVVTMFAISSMASGMTVTITATGTSSLELDVVGATYGPYIGLTIEGPGVLSNFAKGPDAPSIAGSFGPINVNGDVGEVWGFGVAAGEPYVDGVWLTADGASNAGVWIIAYETLDGGTTWTELDRVIAPPEPMTVALLGLGGLLILRRRRR